MRDLFEELNSVFRTLTPPLRPGFLPPAEDSALDAAEAALGLAIPRDLRELLSCADGQEFPPTTGPDPIDVPLLPVPPGRAGTDGPGMAGGR